MKEDDASVSTSNSPHEQPVIDPQMIPEFEPQKEPVVLAKLGRFRHGTLGTVSGVQLAGATDDPSAFRAAREQLHFRLHVHDEEGNVIDETQVTLRARQIENPPQDGDEVVVLGSRTRFGIRRPKGIYICRTGEETRWKAQFTGFGAVLYWGARLFLILLGTLGLILIGHGIKDKSFELAGIALGLCVASGFGHALLNKLK